jgi:protein-disulfide isomerase
MPTASFSVTRRQRLLTALTLVCLFCAACATLEVMTRREGLALQAEVAALRERLQQLEATVAKTTTAAEPTVVQPVKWADTAATSRRLGRSEAPVVIVEFSDLQCPYCRRFDEQTFPWLRREYIDTGKVRFESRDFPLDFHPQAMAAALLARCAAARGKFWDWRTAIFQQQGALATNGLEQAANTVALTAADRASCATQATTQLALIQTEAAAASAIGVRGTPSFLIGRVVNGQVEGQLLVGAGLPETFRKRIDPLLKP